MSEPEQLTDIVTPHAHDVLSGRGNFVNHHSGNENFRALVKKHKKEYVACPKAQKPMYSILIYDEIRAMSPPGRFLKQDPATKLWSDIGKKKALDKTRQALREGAPEMLKEMSGGDDGANEDQEEDKTPLSTEKVESARKKREDNILTSSIKSNLSIGSFSIDGFNDSLLGDLSNNQSTGNGNSAAWNTQNNEEYGNGNQGIMSAQMLLLQQQMNQLQQVTNLQNSLQNSGNGDRNTQMQLLQLQMQLQMQLQNQTSQQQNQPQLHSPLLQQMSRQQGNGFGNQQQVMSNLPNFNHPQDIQNQTTSFNTNRNFSQTSSVPPSQANDPNIAALLSAIHSNAASQNMQNQNVQTAQSMSLNSTFQQLQNQMNLQQLNHQCNKSNVNQEAVLSNASSSNWGGVNKNCMSGIISAASSNNGNIEDRHQSQFSEFNVPLNDTSNEDGEIVGMRIPLQSNERKPGGTSLARSQRIGLKNSFTRRPNSHRQLTTTVANSLMSLDSLNLNDLEEMQDDD